MPRGDRTGPRGEGPGTGRGKRQGAGGRGQGGGFRAGSNENCICPSCGETVIHQRGNPCFEQNCPKCGATMTRE